MGSTPIHPTTMYKTLNLSKKYPESTLAHKYLDGMQGVEIGGSAHNPFGLNTINVDRYESMSTDYKEEEFNRCGEKLRVDIVSEGDDLPFNDKSFDFVISSHVLEHFYDPIKALKEWGRVATMYIFIIVPHIERTFDLNKPITTYEELVARQTSPVCSEDFTEDTHHNIWDLPSFLAFLNGSGYDVVSYSDTDDKVGNGMMAVIKL